MRIFSRYDRRLVVKLYRMDYETVRDALRRACGTTEGDAGCVGADHTFGNLIGWQSLVHSIACEGVFKRDDASIRVVNVERERCTEA